MDARHVTAMAVFAMVLAFGVGVADAQVYKWIDDQGRTHYDQQPPAPAVATPKKLDIALTGNDPARAVTGCYSIQCQYERLRDDRLLRDAEWRKDEESRARIAAERRAAEEPPMPVSDPRWSGYYPGSPLIVGRPYYRPRVPVALPARPSTPPEPSVRIKMQVGR